jgi:nitric oxide reductase large subunit
MTTLAATIIKGSTLLKLVVGALVAGLGVTVAFSLLIFCAERAIALRRSDQRTAAIAFQAASILALLAVVGIVAYGLILTVSKPK